MRCILLHHSHRTHRRQDTKCVNIRKAKATRSIARQLGLSAHSTEGAVPFRATRNDLTANIDKINHVGVFLAAHSHIGQAQYDGTYRRTRNNTFVMFGMIGHIDVSYIILVKMRKP